MAKAITRDWKFSGIFTLQSGRHFSINATGDPLAGISGARVDLIGEGNPVLSSDRSKGEKVAQYFDTTRFRNPAPNTLGTLGRNSLEGPGFANVDVSMVKGFRLPLGEAGLGQLRFVLSTDGDPRILQLALKIMF